MHLKVIATEKNIKTNLFDFIFFEDRRAKEDSEGNAGSPVPEAPPFVPPPGSVIYTALPDGAPAPQGMGVYAPAPAAATGAPVAPGSIIHGPAPVGSQLVYGPLPPNFAVPLIPLGVLHCNVPEHQDLVRSRAAAAAGTLGN